MPKYTKEELHEKRIVVKCNSQEQADYIVGWIGNGVEKNGYNADYGDIYCRNWSKVRTDFYSEEFCISNYTMIDFAEQFPEYEQTVSEPTPASIPTEYAVLTNATESAKKQIAEFEQVLAQIKIDAMKLGTRDLARLIKALKAI